MLVSVIVPCRNERHHIERFLDNVLRQRSEGFQLEILVADGHSDDGTREIVEQFAAKYPYIRLIDNPRGIVSTGLNAAIREAQGDIIVRMDVHTEYADDYIARCVDVLLRTGAENVGGPWVARGSDLISRAIALAFQSHFGSGGAKSHDPNYEGPVDSVYLGCWPRRTFERFGLFDEDLVRNQDNEHNLRIWRMGGRVWQSPAIRSWYHPRSSLRKLWRQYVQYGYWKTRVVRKHRIPASPRHLIPGAFVGVVTMLGGIGLVSSTARTMWVVLLLVYGLALIGASAWVCKARNAWRYFYLIPVVFAIMQIGYGYGFLMGLADIVFRQGRSTDALASLSR
ncbi:MAG: glycosyltransferase family 2 protein [Limnochordaceae bacterium]|nr:glycosyltransferase family 2 protein [Limnochordaceae bacterium]